MTTTLDADPDVADVADLYQAMLAQRIQPGQLQVRNWAKWHEEHPYLHHPRPKHGEPPPIPRMPRPAKMSHEEKIVHAANVDRFQHEAEEIHEGRYAKDSSRGQHFVEGYIQARLDAQSHNLSREEAKELAESHLAATKDLKANQARAKREGVAAGYAMHASADFLPKKTEVVPSEPPREPVKAQVYAPTKLQSGRAKREELAVGDIIPQLDYTPIASITGKKHLTVTFESGHKQVLGRRRYEANTYDILPRGAKETPADRAGITRPWTFDRSDPNFERSWKAWREWSAFNVSYDQAVKKHVFSDSPLGTEEAKTERDKNLAEAERERRNPSSYGSNGGNFAGKAQAYQDILDRKNGLRPEDRTVADLRPGDFVGYTWDRNPVTVVSNEEDPISGPNKRKLTLTSEEGTYTMQDSPSNIGPTTATGVGTLARAHGSNVGRVQASHARAKASEDAKARGLKILEGSPSVPFTPEHLREGRRQAAELLLHRQLTGDSESDYRTRMAIQHHYDKEAGETIGDSVERRLRAGGTISGGYFPGTGSKWQAELVKAIHDSKNSEDFSRLAPERDPGASLSQSRAQDQALEAAKRAFEDVDRFESDADAKAAVAAAHEMAADIADRKPRTGGLTATNELRVRIENQMGTGRGLAQEEEQHRAMTELGGLNTEDFARHAAVMEKGAEIAARIDAHPEVQEALKEAERAHQAYGAAPEPRFKSGMTEAEDQLYSDQIDAKRELRAKETAAERDASDKLRAATLEELSKERSMGDDEAIAAHPHTGTDNKIEAAFRKALKVYPAQWIRNSALGRHLALKSAKSRAHYQDFGARTRQLIKRGAPEGVSVIKTRPGDDPTMVHEIGHRMEYTNMGLMRLEATHLEVRAPNTTPKLMRGYKREYSRADQFFDQYAGKVYKDRPGPDRAHEIFTMGVQSLLGDTGYGTYGRLVGLGGQRKDLQTRNFILGAMALHANPDLQPETK
jgi:hypothetical protein